jgi:hypothetical protein
VDGQEGGEVSLNLTFRPISTWPGVLTKPTARVGSPFKAIYEQTLALLEKELEHLGARNVVLELDLTEADLRLDGMVRAHAKPGHPGVVVSFDSRYGPLRYATDLYADSWVYRPGNKGTVLVPGWQSNLRAIALGLEALRKVDRYGITKRGEQYAGWKAITQGSETLMTADEALLFLATTTGMTPLEVKVDMARAFRKAVKILHPDVPGTGNALGFDRLTKAKALLDNGRKP